MPPVVFVKPGVEFRPDLFAKPDPADWLDAVGSEIANRGVVVKVGDGAAAVEVKDAASLKGAMTTLQQAASIAGVDVKAYVKDLMEALDDAVKPTSKIAAGDVLDLTTTSDVSKALGLGTGYAAPSTSFAQRPDGVLSVLGVRLQNKASEPDVLDGVKYIDATTFAGAQSMSGRDDLEVEAVRAVAGISKEDLYAMLTKTDDKGRTVLQKLQKNKDSIAFGVGYQGMSIDEVSWDSTSAKVRQLNPYISLTVEGGRMEPDPKTGAREISVGRDTFFDVFYATKNPITGKLTRDLLDNNVMVRARLRIDDESGKPTRILIQVKLGTEVDTKYGVKSDAKADIRTDQPTDDTAAHLDESVKTGKLVGEGWYDLGAVIDPIAQVYTFLKSKGVLKDYGPHHDVLVMDQAACARQVRGRYHLNETEPQALLGAFKECSGKLADMKAAIDGSPTLDAATKAKLSAQAGALIDHSEIVKRATDGLKKIDPNMVVDVNAINALWPDTFQSWSPNGGDPKLDAKKRKVVADAIGAAYGDFTKLFDDTLEQKIAGNVDKKARKVGGADEVSGFLQAKATAAKFMTWSQSQANSGVVQGQPATYQAYLSKLQAMSDGDLLKMLANSGIAVAKLKDVAPEMLSTLTTSDKLERVQTVAPFLAEFDAQLAGANKDQFVSELAAYMLKKGNDALSTATDKGAVLATMRTNIVFGNLEVLHRQVEESSTLAQTLWFDSVRNAYCGVQRQGWSNFIIDSFDLIEEYNLENGLALTKEQRGSRKPLDVSKMVDFKIGNDFQIELGYEVPYVNAIDKASSAIDVAAGGVFMDYALQKQGSGVVGNDPASFTKYLDAQLKGSAADRKAFVADVQAFGKQKGSALVLDESMLKDVATHAHTVDLLMAYAKSVNAPNLNVNDPATLDAFLKSQLGWQSSADKKTAFLNDLTDFFSKNGSPTDWTEKRLQTYDVGVFAQANQGKPGDGHAQLVEDLEMAKFVWETLLEAQERVADFRGQHVLDEAKKQGFNVEWKAPAGSKGGETVEKVLAK